jgi:hypothetical protein
MTTFTSEDRQAVTCPCGRSPIAQCVGWHALTEEEYHKRKDEYELNEYRKQASSLWFNGGGSCTGGQSE